jgi:cardiolipin synthase
MFKGCRPMCRLAWPSPSSRLRCRFDVRILTAGPRTDVNIVRLAGRARCDTLLAAGVRVYEWQPTTLHAKTFVVDGEWSTIGSMNFDNRLMALIDVVILMVLDRKVSDG